MNFIGFRPKRMLDGSEPPSPEPLMIANSVTFQEGDPVKRAAGNFARPADAVADVIYGYVVGFIVFSKGHGLVPLRQHNAAGLDGGTLTKSEQGDTYVADSDNETDDRVCVLVVKANEVICSAKPDATPGRLVPEILIKFFKIIVQQNQKWFAKPAYV